MKRLQTLQAAFTKRRGEGAKGRKGDPALEVVANPSSGFMRDKAMSLYACMFFNPEPTVSEAKGLLMKGQIRRICKAKLK